MPANLPPAYFEAEKRFREAKTPADKLACLDEMLAIVPKHKGTDKLRADLRKRSSKLKSATQAKKGPSKRESAFSMDREGAGQVVIVGPANVGKSSLVATLTNANPEVAPFPYTTWKPMPGMMPVENIQIQLIDTPPLGRDYVEPAFMDLIRRADLVLLMVDLKNGPLKQWEDSVALLEEHHIVPHHLKQDDAEQTGFTFVPFVVLANKNDDEDSQETFDIFVELAGTEWTLVSCSVTLARHLTRLKQALVEGLDIIRVYSKSPGKKPDFSSPFVLRRGSTIVDFAGKIHKDFLETFKAARVWGTSVYDGQMVQRDYVLHDEDVVELQT
ncbi:MAG: TGS domain-containing protein [Thermodesulfobacteriota bacterium]|nr:TGS domain-containing protein [Thermodesulfobacteriota bacterium]